MLLNHVAIVSSSEEKSDKFYQGVLGLEKKGPRVLQKDLVHKLFNVDKAYTLITYEKGPVKFEIFVTEEGETGEQGVNHVCIDVAHRDMFLKKCAEKGVDILQIPRGEHALVFIKDFDGNQFEVKEKI